MMIVYLASPDNRQQAEAVVGMPVLLSFALATKKSYLEKEYAPTFRRLLIDSGAFSELNSGVRVELKEYAEWSDRWEDHADAVAGLDDISGDWRRSLRNYEAFPKGFPTFHDTDPPELLNDLITLSRERGSWIGLGLKPPRKGKENWIRRACDRIPDNLHVHGWAMREYTQIRRLDSVDSTNWWRDGMKYRRDFPWLTYGECLELVVKRYQRWKRVIKDKDAEQGFFN